MLDNMASPAELDALQTALGISFKDVALLQQALTLTNDWNFSATRCSASS